MTLTLATPEQKAQRAAERAVYFNSTIDGHECDANGIYVNSLGKKVLSRARLNSAIKNSAQNGNFDEKWMNIFFGYSSKTCTSRTCCDLQKLIFNTTNSPSEARNLALSNQRWKNGRFT